MKPIIRLAVVGLLGSVMFASVELSAITWGNFALENDPGPKPAALTWGS
jgi:hypothetical protein